MAETKQFELVEDQLNDDEVLLAIFEDQDAAVAWVNEHAPEETYTGPDITGKQVTVEDVDWWPGYNAKVKGTDEEVEVTVVYGYIPSAEETSS